MYLPRPTGLRLGAGRLQGSHRPHPTPTQGTSQGTCFGLDNIMASGPHLAIHPAVIPPEADK